MWLTKDASHKAADVDEEFSKRRVFEFRHASSCSVCMALLQQNTILLVRISHIGQSLSFVPRRRDAAHQLAVLLHENRKLGTHPAAVCCMHACDDCDTAADADDGEVIW